MNYLFFSIVVFCLQHQVELAPNDTVLLGLSNGSFSVFSLSSQFITKTIRTSSQIPLVKYFTSGYAMVSYDTNQLGVMKRNYYHDTDVNEGVYADCDSLFYEQTPNGHIMLSCFTTTIPPYLLRLHYIDHDSGTFSVSTKQYYIKWLNTLDMLASSDQSGAIWIWIFSTRQLYATISETTGRIILLERVPHNDFLLLSTASNNMIKVTNFATASTVSFFDTQIVTTNVMKLLANDILAVAGVSNQVKLLKINPLTNSLSSFQTLNISGTTVYAVSFTYNCLILVGSDQGMEIYNMVNLKLVKLVSLASVNIINMDTFGFDVNSTYYDCMAMYNKKKEKILAPNDGYYETQLTDYSITYSPNDFISWSQVPNLFVCLNKCRTNSQCQLVLYQPSNNCSLLNTNTTIQTLFYSTGSILYQKIPF